MIIKDERTLKHLLSANTSDDDVSKILDQWMSSSCWGTEEEACRLIRFIKTWDSFTGKMRTREKRTAMLNNGITHRIECHFTGIEKNGSTLKPHSIDLLSYGLYGPDGTTKKKIKENRLNDQIAHDSLQEFRHNNVNSKRKTSNRISVDRKTVTADRNDKSYSSGVVTNNQVLQEIDRKGK